MELEYYQKLNIGVYQLAKDFKLLGSKEVINFQKISKLNGIT